MSPKVYKKGQKIQQDNIPSTNGESDEMSVSSNSVSLTLMLEGDSPGPGDWILVAVYGGHIILDGKWRNGGILETDSMLVDLKDSYFQDMFADRPLILLLRLGGGKGAKDIDPFLNTDNRAGATVDLFPLILGEDEVTVNVPLVYLTTGRNTTCNVQVHAKVRETLGNITSKVPLLITMISAHCLPVVKEGTVYIASIGFDGILEQPFSVNFGMSLSNLGTTQIMWASVNNGGHAANTTMNVPNEDNFIPLDFEALNNTQCNSVYWNAMKRVLVNPSHLRQRLSSPFSFELAGVPRFGKIEVRGHYMGFIDGGVLLEPEQHGVTICAKLLFYNEADWPKNVGPLLELPPTSAKFSARESGVVIDEFGHNAYIVIRFDLTEPLTPKSKIALLYESIGFQLPEGPALPITGIESEQVREDPTVDVRRIRRECSALAVHEELNGLACRGTLAMNQGIKMTPANHLFMRIQTMLRQFPPGNCSFIDWQDVVTGQHASSRRAITSSFAPQPPPTRERPNGISIRCQLTYDDRIVDYNLENNLKITGYQKKYFLSKALRCLEEGNDLDARKYILEALSRQVRNRFLLWIYGAQKFDRGQEATDVAAAAFRIAMEDCPNDYFENTSNTIGWAALHALYHFNNNHYAAFVAAKKMRKSYELPKEWKKFIKWWVETSGEEETFWIPASVTPHNPLLMAAAFFLCLRCFNFTERLLLCVESGCAIRGSRFRLKIKVSADQLYIRAATSILRQEFDKALDITNKGIKSFGPTAIMLQMRLSCLSCLRDWDSLCEGALQDADRAGAESCPAILLKAAKASFRLNPKESLQWAARAHRITPCAHSALIISRIYMNLEEESLSERWASAAVKFEPLLADAWAVLAILSMHQRNLDKAKTMLRTANQVGPISLDIQEEVNKICKTVKLEPLPDSLAQNLCFCKYD